MPTASACCTAWSNAIYDVGQAFADPQTQHLQMTMAAPHPRLGDVALVRSPITLSAHERPTRFDRAAPEPGAHTREVLQEFGYDAAQIAALTRAGVIA